MQVIAGMAGNHRPALHADIRRMMDAANATAKGTSHWLFWCKSGKHRSVAMGAFAKWLLLMHGATVPSITAAVAAAAAPAAAAAADCRRQRQCHVYCTYNSI